MLEDPKKASKQEMAAGDLSKPAKSAWDIDPPPLAEFFNKLKEKHSIPDDAQFSILKNAKRNMYELAELAAAVSRNASDLITFKPRRMAFLEAVAIIETEVQINEDDDLAPIVNGIYNKILKPRLKEIERSLEKEVDGQAIEWATASIKRVKAGAPLPEDAETAKLWNIINDRIKAGNYTPGLYDEDATSDSVLLKLVQDKKYNELMQKKVVEIIEPLIQGAIKDKSTKYPIHNNRGKVVGQKSLEPLSQHAGNKRHTFMFAGAPACGKGSAVGIMAVKAEGLGVKWQDVVKINTDVHRNIVSGAQELGEITEFHTALNNDESFYITQRAYQRMMNKIKSGRAPHMLIDGVYPAPQRISMSLENSGQLHLAVVTVPVEVSIKRAYQRGIETGRFISSGYLISSHQSVSRDLHKTLLTFSGESIEYDIYDTNVAFGELPRKFEHGDMRERVISVYDPDAAGKFYGKKNINIKAKAKEELFPKGVEKSSLEYLEVLKKTGIAIYMFKPEKEILVQRRSQHPRLPADDEQPATPIKAKKLKNKKFKKN